MASVCHTPIGGDTVRVTRLTNLGVPVTGAGSYAVSSTWTSVGMSDNVDSPDEYRVRAGRGGCIAVKTQPKLNWIDVTAVFARVDPELLRIITGQPVVGDVFGNSVGWAAEDPTYATGSFALELWTRLTRPEACPVPSYGYLLLPWIVGGVSGGVTHDRGNVSFTVQATTQTFNGWGVGPYSVVANAAGTPVPLFTPIPVARQRHWQVTPIPAPEPACGALTL